MKCPGRLLPDRAKAAFGLKMGLDGARHTYCWAPLEGTATQLGVRCSVTIDGARRLCIIDVDR